MSGWYSMLTEVLACNACRRAVKETKRHSIGRFLAWDACIIKLLSPAHQAMFPAMLTRMRGVDKQIVRLMREHTEGNAMAKVWRQVLESHCEEYLQRKDLYTTLLSQLNKPGGIMRTNSHWFQRPLARRELPSLKLLRKAFLIAEAESIEDYRIQIMSTFGSPMSLWKNCGQWLRASWRDTRGRERSLLSSCRGLGLLSCSRDPSLEELFSEWAKSGMMVGLDIFHWIKRFDAAVRTDHHSKYPLFKSVLSAAVFAYNKDDMALLIQATRAGSPTKLHFLTDSEIIEHHISKNDFRHHVSRITVRAQETFACVQRATGILKGVAGMDKNQIHLFRDAAAINRVGENQQKHLKCMQDPPGRDMYTITK
ncbi:uncharacterized protein LOC121521826 [Cheilinus undulatus]|uniref:uncharacterized protein LOC121521826 n=1 Tax=Cheilinus undulatus TaxID=241271 RepID=UPI001BD3E36B|nr:uncharacterized protein LOC121521826 [Cheilinus undulatus]